MKVTKYINEVQEKGRSCGTCTVCCVLPRIQDRPTLRSLPLLPEGKLGYTPCQYLGDGCTRYDERPQVCSEFECEWKNGSIAGDERRRPDNLGLMMTIEGEDIESAVIDLWEVWPGAASNHPGRGMVDALHRCTRRLAIRFYGVPANIQYFGPETLALGNTLSYAARNAPKELVAYLEHKVRTRQLAMPDDSALADILAMANGEPVKVHFGPKTEVM